MKKVVLFLALITLLVPAVFAGGGQEAGDAGVEKSEINVFYYKDTIVDGMDALAEAFMAANPNVTIKNEMVTTEFNTVLKTKDAAGALPELWAAQPGERAMKAYIDAGKVQAVDDFAVLDLLSNEFKESITFSDGHIYVIPMLTTARGLIYNKGLFESVGYSEFPATLSELREACEKLEAKGIVPFAAAAKDGWTLGSLVYQCGAEVLDTPDFAERMWNGEASHSEIADIFDFVDLFKEFSQENGVSTDFMGSVALYAQEKAAMIIQGPWAADAALELAPEVIADSAMVGIPYTDDPARNKLYIDYDAYFAVSAAADADAVDAYFSFMLDGAGKAIFSEQIKSLNPYGIGFESHAVNASIIEASKNGEIIGDVQYANAPDGWWQTQAIVMQEYFADMIGRDEAVAKLDEAWGSM